MRDKKTQRKVTILGLGETGRASALFLKKRGYSVFVSERGDSDLLRERSLDLKKAEIPFELGKHTLARIEESDWVLISPGIPPSADIYRSLCQEGIPLLSEIEVASWFSSGEVVAVTGTTGKSTMVTLIHRIFEAHGIPSVACGNIGNPWIGEIDRITPETQVVLEVSSFQLLHTFSLKPHLAILLNLGSNHLDWHPNLDDYVQAKLRIFKNQTAEDHAFIRRQDQKIFFPHFQFKANVVYFGEKETGSNEELLYEISRIKRLDFLRTQSVLSCFEGLEHRLEKVREVDGVQFVNDSKCTTVEALLWALNRFPAGRIILLAGGHAKGADFRSVRDSLAKKLKHGVVYGEAGDLLWESWKGAISLTRTVGLEEAFREALKRAQPGDTVLLSPACASFDQFANYRERGKFFKKLVLEIQKTHV